MGYAITPGVYGLNRVLPPIHSYAVSNALLNHGSHLMWVGRIAMLYSSWALCFKDSPGFGSLYKVFYRETIGDYGLLRTETTDADDIDAAIRHLRRGVSWRQNCSLDEHYH